MCQLSSSKFRQINFSNYNNTLNAMIILNLYLISTVENMSRIYPLFFLPPYLIHEGHIQQTLIKKANHSISVIFLVVPFLDLINFRGDFLHYTCSSRLTGHLRPNDFWTSDSTHQTIWMQLSFPLTKVASVSWEIRILWRKHLLISLKTWVMEFMNRRLQKYGLREVPSSGIDTTGT